MQLPVKFPARAGALCAAALSLAACASPIERLIADHELEHAVIAGSAFEHTVFRKTGGTTGGRLHVYIDGDGTPWIDGNVMAIDPTPSDPLALRLMLLDGTDSVYVGRPCYFGMSRSSNCEHDVWTFGRYSADVVESMATAIAALVSDGDYTDVRLIGYSGGGVIALLVAGRIPVVTSVVTIAANLDTEEWTRSRGFLPLRNSLNPADSEPLPASVLHVQLAGGRDEVVPLSVTESFRRSGHASELWVYADFDHRCCWERIWPGLLERLESAISSRRVTVGSQTNAGYRQRRAPAK